PGDSYARSRRRVPGPHGPTRPLGATRRRRGAFPMTTAYALRDSTTMLRRNLLHLKRYPGLSLFPIFMPVVFLLLFVYVFGGTLGNGIKVGGGRGTYIDFLTPGMLLVTVAGAAQITAISVAKDMTEGIIARFKTMRIW